jgi:hypothetical protein
MSRPQRRRRTKQPTKLDVPDGVQDALRFVVMHLETIHAVAAVAHDVLTREQSERESYIAHVIREGVMNALSVQMDALREMAGEQES